MRTKTKTTSDNIRLRCRVKPDVADRKALQWYTDAKNLIQELYGDNWRLFVDILASTSPRQSVKRNWRQSARLLQAYIDRKLNPDRFADLLAKCMPAHLTNVIRSLQGRPISGPKVSRFAENLKGNLDAVTIDTWILQAYGIPEKKLTARLYNRLEKRIQADAKRQGLKPANYQALLWYAIRRESGKNPKSFVSVYRSIFCETPCFAFMQE